MVDLEAYLKTVESEIEEVAARKDFHDKRDHIYVPTSIQVSVLSLEHRNENPFESNHANQKMIDLEGIFNVMVSENYQHQLAKQQDKKIKLTALKNVNRPGVFLLDKLQSFLPDYFLLRGIVINKQYLITSFKGLLDSEHIRSILENGAVNGITFKEEAGEFKIYEDMHLLAKLNTQGRGSIKVPYQQLLSHSREKYSRGIQHLAELVTVMHHDVPLIRSVPEIDMKKYLPIFKLLSPESYLPEKYLGQTIKKIINHPGDLASLEILVKTKRKGRDHDTYRLATSLPHIKYFFVNPQEKKIVIRYSCILDIDQIREVALKKDITLSEKEYEKKTANKFYLKGDRVVEKTFNIFSNRHRFIGIKGKDIGSIEGKQVITVPYGELSENELEQSLSLLNQINDQGLMYTFSAPIVDRNTHQETNCGLMKGELELFDSLRSLDLLYNSLINFVLGKQDYYAPRKKAPDWIHEKMKPEVKEANPVQRIFWVLEAMNKVIQDYKDAPALIQNNLEHYGQFKTLYGGFQALQSVTTH